MLVFGGDGNVSSVSILWILLFLAEDPAELAAGSVITTSRLTLQVSMDYKNPRSSAGFVNV